MVEERRKHVKHAHQSGGKYTISGDLDGVRALEQFHGCFITSLKISAKHLNEKCPSFTLQDDVTLTWNIFEFSFIFLMACNSARP